MAVERVSIYEASLTHCSITYLSSITILLRWWSSSSFILKTISGKIAISQLSTHGYRSKFLVVGCPSSHQLTEIREETMESGNFFISSWISASDVSLKTPYLRGWVARTRVCGQKLGLDGCFPTAIKVDNHRHSLPQIAFLYNNNIICIHAKFFCLHLKHLYIHRQAIWRLVGF